MTLLPLTLLAGGPGLAQLLGQRDNPAAGCSVVGSQQALARAGIEGDVGIAVNSVPTPASGSRSPADLARGIVQGIEQNPNVERLIVALDATDDTAAVAHAVLSDLTLRSLVRLDGIIVTVDAVQLSTRLMAAQPVASPIGLDRLAMADRILVARSQDVTPLALGAIAHVLRSINQTGPIIAPAIAPCTWSDLLDLKAWSGSPAVGPRPDRSSPFLGPDTPNLVVCRRAEPVDPHAFDHWLDGVLHRHADSVLRIQGAVSVVGGRPRTYLCGVRSCLIRSYGHPNHADAGDSSSLVALVGRRLPESAIQASFASCPR